MNAPAPEIETTDRIASPTALTPRIVSVRHTNGARLAVAFADGAEREVDLTPVLGLGVFRPLADVEAFAAVSIVEGGGGIEWASGADLCADTLYAGGPSVPMPRTS